MSILRKSVIATAFLAAGASIQAQEVSANIGVTSDYVWRGVSQTSEIASISGGVDYATDGGFYAGTWVGSLGDNATGFTGSEVDLYAGYGGSISDTVSYDVGYIYYWYPSNDDIDFGEIYGGLGIGAFSVGIAVTTNSGGSNDDGLFEPGDIFYSAGVGGNLSDTWTAGLTLGYYTFTNDGDAGVGPADYFYYQVDFGKSTDLGDFTLSLIDTSLSDANEFNAGDSDAKAVVSWGIGF